MNADSCFELGYVIKPHGLRGELKVFIDADNPDDYCNLESVFLEQQGQLVPYFIQSLKLLPNHFIVQFKNIVSFEAANSLKGARLFLPLEQLSELKNSQFYFHEIIGFTAVDQTHQFEGKVISVMDGPVQSHMVIGYQNKELLLPITDETVGNPDREKKQIFVNFPDGLIELYLSDPNAD